MDKNYKKILKICSILFSITVFVLNNDQSIFKTISSFQFEQGIVTFFEYLLLGLVFYKFLDGIVVSDKKFIFRNILILFIINLLIYSVIFFISPNVTIDQFLNLGGKKYFIGYSVFSIAASFVNTSIFNDYRKDLTESAQPNNVVRKQFIRSIFATLGLYYVFVKFVNPLFENDIFYNQSINYILVAIITIIFLGIFYFLDKKKSQLEKEIVKESTKAETATAKFESLKNQLDPHFLFNSLNVLTGLIEENPENAIDFTTSLSKIYRYVLEQKDKEVVPIQEELIFAKTYINLLKLRFENSIDFELDQSLINDGEFIVPLSLQILLENTIKHNIVSEQKPLKIKIYKQDNNLIVENTLQPKDSIKDSTGVGLNNIINRYQLISNREVVIAKENNLFQVKIPILTQKTTTMQIIENQNEQQAYQRAIERAKELKRYYTSLGTYVIFCIFFFVLNYFTSYGNWWFYWPMIGWGLSIALKTINVYNFGSDWEENKAKEIYEKEQNKKWQ